MENDKMTGCKSPDASALPGASSETPLQNDENGLQNAPRPKDDR